MADKPHYQKSAQNLYDDELAGLRKPAELGEARDFTGDGNDTSGYVGVDPIYRNYADEKDKPLQAEEGATKHLEELLNPASEMILTGKTYGEVPEDKAPKEGDGGDSSSEKSKEPSQSTPPPPPPPAS